MDNQKQVEKLSVSWLYSRGYTVSAAARRVSRTTTHVRAILTGQRTSKALENALRKLPPRPMVLRERVTTSKKGARA